MVPGRLVPGRIDEQPIKQVGGLVAVPTRHVLAEPVLKRRDGKVDQRPGHHRPVVVVHPPVGMLHDDRVGVGSAGHDLGGHVDQHFDLRVELFQRPRHSDERTLARPVVSPAVKKVAQQHLCVAPAARAVQFHPHGGQFDFVWLSARTPHGAYVW